MADEKTAFGSSGHVIPRRERSGNEVILPQLLEGDALDLLVAINAGIERLNANMALIAEALTGGAVSDTA